MKRRSGWAPARNCCCACRSVGALDGGGKPQACGWLIDRFGVRWQIVPKALDELMRNGDANQARRVADAMLKMVKLDVATLEAAFRS